MARAVKATRATKPVAKAPPAKSVPTARRGAVAAASAPKLGKEELRAQVEKLERANATLRAKNKQAGQSAKVASARVSELEAQVEQLEQAAAAQKAASQKAESKKAAPQKVAPQKAASKPPAQAAARKARPAKPAAAKAGKAATQPEIDPGDAVPPGVAVAEPLAMDEEAETAKENLERHLNDE